MKANLRVHLRGLAAVAVSALVLKFALGNREALIGVIIGLTIDWLALILPFSRRARDDNREWP